MAEWGEIEKLAEMVDCFRGSFHHVGDARKGFFIMKVENPFNTNGNINWQLQLYHQNSCKMKISKVSIRDNVKIVDQCVGGLGDRPVATLLHRAGVEKTPGYVWFSVVIEFQMSKACPCRHCEMKKRFVRERLQFYPLHTSFKRLLSSTDSADVVFHVGDADIVEIKAHKLILTTRYDYFQTMFSSGMKESSSNQVEVKDIDPDTFRATLEFIYCGELPVDFASKAADFLPVAERYGMEDLKSLCCLELKKSLTAENLFEHFSMARMYRIPDLATAALNYVEREKQLPKELFAQAVENFPIQDDDEELEQICVFSIVKNLTPENVVEALLAANKGQNESLKLDCFKAIKKFRSEGSLKEGVFKPLSEFPDLMAETICNT